MEKPVACWHHGDEERLLKHLRCGRIDLYGRNEVTTKGNNRLSHWWGKMRLENGDRIRIVVGGHVHAFATITSEPYDLPISEVCGVWGSAVDLKDIHVKGPPFQTASCKHLPGSHRFDGPKTSLLER
jgi:hypothetical protein